MTNEEKTLKMQAGESKRHLRREQKYMPTPTWKTGDVLYFYRVSDFLLVHKKYKTPFLCGNREVSFGSSGVKTLRYYGALPISTRTLCVA